MSGFNCKFRASLDPFGGCQISKLYVAPCRVLVECEFAMAADGVCSCQFEVFGKVKGVNFRRHVLRKARTLGLRGWCRNSEQNTVRGYIEGPSLEMDVMKEWLKTTGSPESNIKMVKFSSHRKSDRYGYPNFEIRPDQSGLSDGRKSVANSSNESV